MDNLKELILEDVRCFRGEQRGSLRPITLLVGENSTGKTTFLGCYGVLQQVFSAPDIDDRLDFNIDDRLDFNEEPFSMGSFRDVVRSRRGPEGRIDAFKLGLTLEPSRGRMTPHRLVATFRESGSQPIVSSLRFEFGAAAFLELQRSPNGTVLTFPGRDVAIDFPFGQVMLMLDFLMTLTEDRGRIPREFPNLQPVVDYFVDLFPRRDVAAAGRRRRSRAIGWWRLHLPRLIPVAPLRSKPKRTYDPVRDTASPEGAHVPMLMMRLDLTDKSHWTSLHDDLVTFGKESGLFSDVKVKRHGKQMSDPFQLQVKVRSGPNANIMDVGYGVSQSLPILVDVLAGAESDRRKNGGRVFLLQQPEVHLHPRGQAELASLFIEASRSGSRFLIETHSDYIVDRVRISVRNGSLQSDDVSILYFEPAGNAVTIHNLTLDEDGNLRDAPAGYRDFFVRESDHLLGFTD